MARSKDGGTATFKDVGVVAGQASVANSYSEGVAALPPAREHKAVIADGSINAALLDVTWRDVSNAQLETRSQPWNVHDVRGRDAVVPWPCPTVRGRDAAQLSECEVGPSSSNTTQNGSEWAVNEWAGFALYKAYLAKICKIPMTHSALSYDHEQQMLITSWRKLPAAIQSRLVAKAEKRERAAKLSECQARTTANDRSEECGRPAEPAAAATRGQNSCSAGEAYSKVVGHGTHLGLEDPKCGGQPRCSPQSTTTSHEAVEAHPLQLEALEVRPPQLNQQPSSPLASKTQPEALSADSAISEQCDSSSNTPQHCSNCKTVNILVVRISSTVESPSEAGHLLTNLT